MPVELKLLVWSVALTLVQLIVVAVGANFAVGAAVLAGNRETMPPIEGWAGRAIRAHRNMLENLVMFAALVLTAQVAGRTGAMTALGAQLFFWARVAYAVIYVAGIPWLRTAVFTVSIAGLVLILAQLL
jgi:uncharacterized MAPEG superfamily protein